MRGERSSRQGVKLLYIRDYLYTHAAKEHPTGVLHEILRISPVKNKETHPDGCISLLVDPRRFELPTPTMRM